MLSPIIPGSYPKIQEPLLLVCDELTLAMFLFSEENTN